MIRLSLVLLGVLGCSGTIGDDAPGGDGTLTPPDCTTTAPRMLRRLTSRQMRNTVIAAFGDATVPTTDVLTDPVVLGFRVDATQAVIRDLDAQLIMTNAEAVADWAVTNKLAQLAPCQSTDPVCARQLVETLGQRLYREPVPADSIDGYLAMFAAESSFADGARAVIATMLQSPYFLYRREIGEQGSDGLYHLTPYELASSLSYLLSNGPPDDALVAAAAAGAIDLDREVARLEGLPAADATFGAFATGWLRIDDLLDRAKLDPANLLTPAVRTAMLGETQAVFVNVLRTGAKASELFTAPYTFVDGTLAGYYQLDGGGGGGFMRVDLPPGSRALGILGHGSILTRHALADSSSPVQRGKLVRERLLCEDLPPPPPNVNANPPPPTPTSTTRERYLQHMTDPSCSGCHTRIDPIGFAFEHFDGFGRKRDMENGFPIDATGTLAGTPDGDIALDGLDSLSSYLATSQPAQACLARYYSYFAYGLDHCSTDAIGDELAGSDGSLASLVLAIVHAPQFSVRSP
jgi:uncharacterized protein DUF1588/uncharacterized protein DUF1592/uncharacterized protein DUF1595/uncharacterized protein DUF1587